MCEKLCWDLEWRQGNKYVVSFFWDLRGFCFPASLRIRLGPCDTSDHGLVGVTSGLRQSETYMLPPILPSPVAVTSEAT